MDSYQVLKSFIDKSTGKGYNEGNTFTSTDAERVSFLGNQGYIQAPTSEIEIEIDKTLLAEAKELKIKGYTKMKEEELQAAIATEKAKKESE